jgi:drug/metabolite transporter (DMT)-like permease
MSETSFRAKPARVKLIAAFAAIYLIWGSTYLAIRYAIETIPPFLMAGTRFVLAGVLLYGWARLRGASRQDFQHWRSATVIGGLLFLGGNGALVWAEQRVPSGLAALLLATIPLWMVLLDSFRNGGGLPNGRAILGLLLGLTGLVLLVSPGELLGNGRVDPLGAAVLMFAAASWAIGSQYSHETKRPASALMASAMAMLMGGVLLVLAGLLTGEVSKLSQTTISLPSLLGWLYLIVFGSMVGFTAYNWLLGVSSPARVSTYAYVNPVVAVFLGWALASEPLTLRTLLATLVIVSAVALIILYRTQPAPQQCSSSLSLIREHAEASVCESVR